MSETSDESARQLAAEWPLDGDGFPHRSAARVVVVDPQGRIFLILGHDFDDPDHRWWFTPGGGLEAGERSADGAARELREETGFAVDPVRLVGPVLIRHATFRFALETRKQDEEFFILHVSEEERARIDELRGTSLTALEEQLLDDYAWFSPEEIESADAGVPFYPEGLAGFARGWANWDGTVMEITEA
ncbi:8-oxo-dGTP pyrophosphatase MutT (NUDIX family) [Arcanobacterium wilhelmae]|uniref:8-oxo-dGTP pyrophosphatase MutT (NUDIX family) n=1 Tax=Arcanobacterium wilhelmae TaxID=1803177 RepID=A0ABT9N8N1_9ACTO|nr:NUDIX domain-containing protein [Arcanobacterium wilhelmae]MDP9800067.1 8-oxo-dGTP pyrophosphatase MutT (NUDIX family) [Arcanobacterium wilhelmae]WFN89562.1 NUDIX domain-containing protein [Arcanobacterium wilhelmae]